MTCSIGAAGKSEALKPLIDGQERIYEGEFCNLLTAQGEDTLIFSYRNVRPGVFVVCPLAKSVTLANILNLWDPTPIPGFVMSSLIGSILPKATLKFHEAAVAYSKF